MPLTLPDSRSEIYPQQSTRTNNKHTHKPMHKHTHTHTRARTNVDVVVVIACFVVAYVVAGDGVTNRVAAIVVAATGDVVDVAPAGASTAKDVEA